MYYLLYCFFDRFNICVVAFDQSDNFFMADTLHKQTSKEQEQFRATII